MARKPRNSFDVTLSPEKTHELVEWLAREIEDARTARSATEADLTYWHDCYEQARTRTARDLPWPDAADLTSYIAAEKVDALHARILKTIFTEPIWTVEGWGQASQKAPFVEEFHQWQAEEERLQSYLDRVLLLSLIEPRGVLEVSERTDQRLVRRKIRAALQLDADGSFILGEDNQPVLQVGPDQKFVEVTDEQTPSAEVEIDDIQRIRTGPDYQVIPYQDFVILPGHARDKREVWGYAKRFWRRVPELKQREKDGIYRHVDDLGTEGERESDHATIRMNQEVTHQRDRAAEKELWEVLFLYDLKGEGERWYVATLHVPKRVLLRLQLDDLGQPRFVSFVPFPRPNSVDGYSFVGHKLITVQEEHTAWRNMIADRASVAVQAPIKRLAGALWEPEEVPWGPKAIIDVRDMREIEPMSVPDVPASAFQREHTILQAAERLSGQSDISSIGATSLENRTLGEREIQTAASEIRIDAINKRIQESIEDLAQIRHAIWKRALAEQPAGLQAPKSVLIGLETRGVALEGFDGTFTASMLEGQFRFKPRGSVETADLNRARVDFVQFVQALPALVQTFPMLQVYLSTPQAARAMFEQAIRVHRFPDKQAFLGSEAMQTAQQMQQQQQQQLAMAQQVAASGGAPGPGPAPGGLAPGIPPEGGAMGGGAVQPPGMAA